MGGWGGGDGVGGWMGEVVRGGGGGLGGRVRGVGGCVAVHGEEEAFAVVGWRVGCHVCCVFLFGSLFLAPAPAVWWS